MVKSWPIWQKEVSRFPWEYTESEQCLIVSGKATVTTENGETVRFAAGDFVEFPLGLKCTWQKTELSFWVTMDFIKFTAILVFGLVIFSAAMMFLFGPQG